MNKYIVGTKIIDVIDKSRNEKLGPKTGNRVVVARLYYPAVAANDSKVEIPGKAVGEMYANAEMVRDVRFSLIIYNHGYGACMESNNNLCCKLAENGYIVASVGHAYEAEKLILSDGTQILLDKSIRKRMLQPRFKGIFASLRIQGLKGSAQELYAEFNAFQQKYFGFINERLIEWSYDVLAIVELLKKTFADIIDFERGIGMTGHSLGGALAYYMCMHYDEYVCGANIDGGVFGNYDGMRMKRPFLQICNPGNIPVVSKVFLDTDAPVEYEVFEGTKHLGFTDMAYYKKIKQLMGTLPYKKMNSRLVELHLKFFEKYFSAAADAKV